MASRQILARCILYGALGLAISVISNAIPISDGAASLAIRDPAGTGVSEYINQQELIKRVHVGLFTASLASLSAVTVTACAADIEPASKAAICAIAVIGTVMASLAGVYRGLFGRDVSDPRLPSQLIHYYPQAEGSTTLQQVYNAYNGTRLLVAHSDCYGPGCHEVHYSHKLNKAGYNVIHTFTASPRYGGNSTLARRDKDRSASGHDDGLYGVYNFISLSPKYEKAEGYDGDFPKHMEKNSDLNMYANQGVFCYDIEAIANNRNYDSAGYLTLKQGEPYHDPSKEEEWIKKCYMSH